MYIRFVTPERDPDTGVETGLFGIAVAIKYNDVQAPQWIRQQVTEEVGWFNDHLDRPERLWRRGGRHGPIHGVCWFRPEAHEAINRARYMGWLLTEAGYPVRHLHRRDPGEVIWRDDLQVVAKPPRDLPRLFN